MTKEQVTWFDYDKLASMNASIQTGDVSYFTPITSVGGFDTAGKSDLVELGKIKGVHLIDTTTLDTTDNNGLVNANEAYIQFKGDFEDCGWGDTADCNSLTGIVRINKTYKEAGIISGMQIDIGTADALTSTGTLTTFTDSIYERQSNSSDTLLYVKSVNPNGDDPNEIEIAMWDMVTQGFSANSLNGELARILPTSFSANVGLNKYKSLRYVDGVPQYELDAQFQNRPTRVRFKFDNTPNIFSMPTYPATGTPHPGGTSPTTISPWYGKTKWWMVVAETQAGADSANIGDFQMFSKDNAVNMSSPIGYYAEAKVENNSKIKSEMFAIAVDGRESSK